MADLLLDYYHAVQANLPAVAGELGAAYAIPIVYVPLLMITHIAAFYMLVRPQSRAIQDSKLPRREPAYFQNRIA